MLVLLVVLLVYFLGFEASAAKSGKAPYFAIVLPLYFEAEMDIGRCTELKTLQSIPATAKGKQHQYFV